MNGVIACYVGPGSLCDSLMATRTALGAALLVAPLLLFSFRFFGRETTSWAPRVLLWVLAAFVVWQGVVLAGGADKALQWMGLGAAPSVTSLGFGAAGALFVFVTAGIATFAQRAIGLPVGDRERFAQIAALSFPRRSFLVTTAAVVEEILYRGFAIPFGAIALGDLTAAAALSLAAFTLGHLSWKASQLINVFVAGAVLTGLFLRTNDLWAAIIAHFIVDAVGLLMVPAVMRARASR